MSKVFYSIPEEVVRSVVTQDLHPSARWGQSAFWPKWLIHSGLLHDFPIENTWWMSTSGASADTAGETDLITPPLTVINNNQQHSQATWTDLLQWDHEWFSLARVSRRSSVQIAFHCKRSGSTWAQFNPRRTPKKFCCCFICPLWFLVNPIRKNGSLGDSWASVVSVWCLWKCQCAISLNESVNERILFCFQLFLLSFACVSVEMSQKKASNKFT